MLPNLVRAGTHSLYSTAIGLTNSPLLYTLNSFSVDSLPEANNVDTWSTNSL